MTLAPWRPALARALHRNRARAYCKYLQLATVNAEGRPFNRTVVFRGFWNEALQMVTDGRSEKIQHVKISPWAEICWYFTVTREQFRIAGKLTLVGPDSNLQERRLALWQTMSAKARQQFYWPQPGEPRARETAFEQSKELLEYPPQNFFVMLLNADRVDHLALRGNPQDRHIYERSMDKWMIKAVNP